MRPQTTAAWATAALAGLLLTAPGCVIRRGFVVQFDWSLSAHRTGCRHQWFEGRCRSCNALPCEATALEAENGELIPEPYEPEPCAPCRRRCGGRLGGLFQSEELPPPTPEPPGPSNFHPIPTRPVFGNRAEQPDATEEPMERLTPVPLESSEDVDGEAPDEGEDSAPEEMEEMAPEEQPGEQSAMRQNRSGRSVRSVTWQQARRQQTLPVPHCRSCTVRFK
ncbi:MAG TPA: hypothetical protein VMV10_12585 [Pirellulales bacterium]|nr:hypothetical protein [Pirellulales bacterium]